MNNIKFTVIIPTRERPHTLLYTLKTVVSQDYDNFDIIVSDNFSNDNTKDIVDSFHDPRIKYINPGKRLSMSSHWEFALNHVKEGFVTLLGDDDGLMPNTLQKVSDIILQTKTQAVTSIRNTYGWSKSTIESDRLIISLISGYEIRNGHEWISKLMLENDAICSDLPSLYTGGFVDIEIINKARNKDGKFFLSTSPDVYSAIAIASMIGEYILLKEPIFISGTSIHSTGVASIDCSNSFKYFVSENNIQYHDSISGAENLPSTPISVYDCYLKSEFLHHNFLKIKIEDQLSFALSQDSSTYYNDMINYCKTISAKNNFDFNSIKLKAEKLKSQTKIPKMKKIWDYLFNRRTIYDCKEYGVTDIYGATLLAKTIYLEETKYSHWKLFIILKAIKSILNLSFIKHFSVIRKST